MNCKTSKWILPLAFSLVGFTNASQCLAEEPQSSNSNFDYGFSQGTIHEECIAPVPFANGGLTSFQVFARLAAVNMFDNVLGYKPPVGQRVDFVTNYDYLDAQNNNKRDFSNLGAGWTLNWVAFLKPDEKGNVALSIPGGGTEFYPAVRTSKKSLHFRHNIMSHALLVLRADGVYERRLPDGSVEVYSHAGNGGRKYLSEIKNPAGVPIKVVYDQQSRVTGLKDASGQVSTIKYVSDNLNHPGFFKISEIADPFGRKAIFAYNKDLSQLISCKDPIGLVSSYAYASEKKASIVALTTPYGTTKFREYKPSGSPEGSRGLRISHIDGTSSAVEHWAGDRHETYHWNRRALELYPEDPAKGIHSHCSITKWLTEAGSGKELSIKASSKEPLESEITYSYVGMGPSGFRGSTNQPAAVSRRVQLRSPDGSIRQEVQTYKYQYNPFGHVVRKVDPLGRTFSFLYAVNDIDLHEVRQTGHGKNVLIAKYFYDGFHNALRLADASGSLITNEYNQFGELTKTTDPYNNTTSTKYDSLGRKTAIYSALSDKHPLLSFTYDKTGRVQSMTDVDDKTIVYEYDEADRIIKRQFEDGTVERIIYDKLNPVSFQDRAGKVTKCSYDSQGRITSIQSPDGRKLSYEWCLCGALRKLTDPQGHSTEWHHDLQGRIIQKKFANASQEIYEYEKEGHRLLSKTDALNQKTLFSYNLDDTICARTYENTVNPTSAVNFKYDPDFPLLSSLSNDLGEISYSYLPTTGDRSGPSAGRLSSISNSAIANSKISLEYDATGKVTNLSINGAENPLALSHDALGRLTACKSILGEFRYIYDERNGATLGTNRLASIVYPNGSSVRFDYNSDRSALAHIRNLAANKAEPLCQFDYAYDAGGQIGSLVENFDGKPTGQYSFNYDEQGQLRTVTEQNRGESAPKAKLQYAYDSASNRILSSDDKSRSEFSYNNMNELTGWKTLEAGASEAAEKQESFSYDLNGNLLSDQRGKYKWDAENRLVRIDYADGVRSTEFHYNALGQLEKIRELANNKVTNSKQLIWYLDRICEERDEDGLASKKLFNLGEVVDGKNSYFYRDHLGSTRLVTDQRGNVKCSINYDPFGESSAQGTELPNLLYAGYYKHSTSGLYITLARFYDSQKGRWLSRDPIGELGTAGPDVQIEESRNNLIAANMYAYAGNNGINLVDPLGLQGYNANGQAVRQTVSDTGQNSNGRIWYIGYTGPNQGVTFVDQAPTVTHVSPSLGPKPQVQNITLPQAQQGFGLNSVLPGQGMYGSNLNLLLILPNGMGVYGYIGMPLYVNPKTGQSWQFIPPGYQLQVGGNYYQLKGGAPIACPAPQGPQGHRN